MSEIRCVSSLPNPDQDGILTKDALMFIKHLHLKFEGQRRKLLARRKSPQQNQAIFDFLPETYDIRQREWQVASCPDDLQERRVEITGPVDAKMIINALNSGADVFMADFEDSCSPTWSNLLSGQKNLMQAIRKTLVFHSPEGKEYTLASKKLATLIVRPRGWHLNEDHVWVDDVAVSASLFDFALYFFHNAKELVTQGSGPYFYLPKLESHLEARLWNEVFNEAQSYFQWDKHIIRATVLIETLPAAFEMHEILWELKDYVLGLNAGRWDYLFSFIKKLKHHPDFIFPDRKHLRMTLPFMQAYTNLLVQTCHKRGAQAIGGMSAFIPSRKDLLVNEQAIAEVKKDKQREAEQGFDGTWVAHPDLVPVARKVFDSVIASQKTPKVNDSFETVDAFELTDISVFASPSITEDGVRQNISIAIQYLEKWLSGLGAVAIHNLMEDAATAEISRAQLWQWLKYAVKLSDGRRFSKEIYESIKQQECLKLNGGEKLKDAVYLLDKLVLNDDFTDFLTLPAYKLL